MVKRSVARNVTDIKGLQKRFSAEKIIYDSNVTTAKKRGVPTKPLKPLIADAIKAANANPIQEIVIASIFISQNKSIYKKTNNKYVIVNTHVRKKNLGIKEKVGIDKKVIPNTTTIIQKRMLLNLLDVNNRKICFI